MKTFEVAVRVDVALEVLAPMRGRLEGPMGDETALVLGQALGMLVRARALLREDMAALARGDPRQEFLAV
jgi:hypothetical protein